MVQYKMTPCCNGTMEIWRSFPLLISEGSTVNHTILIKEWNKFKFQTDFWKNNPQSSRSCHQKKHPEKGKVSLVKGWRAFAAPPWMPTNFAGLPRNSRSLLLFAGPCLRAVFVSAWLPSCAENHRQGTPVVMTPHHAFTC